MNLTIRWSPRAASDIANHLDYVKERWGQRVLNKVLTRIEDVLFTISENPVLYPHLEHFAKTKPFRLRLRSAQYDVTLSAMSTDFISGE